MQRDSNADENDRSAKGQRHEQGGSVALKAPTQVVTVNSSAFGVWSVNVQMIPTRVKAMSRRVVAQRREVASIWCELGKTGVRPIPMRVLARYLDVDIALAQAKASSLCEWARCDDDAKIININRNRERNVDVGVRAGHAAESNG